MKQLVYVVLDKERPGGVYAVCGYPDDANAVIESYIKESTEIVAGELVSSETADGKLVLTIDLTPVKTEGAIGEAHRVHPQSEEAT